jgi:hypothetical protein
VTVIERNVAPGIHRVDDAYVNWHAVEYGGELDRREPGRAGDPVHAVVAQVVALVIRTATWYRATEARLPGVSSGDIAFSVASAVR